MVRRKLNAGLPDRFVLGYSSVQMGKDRLWRVGVAPQGLAFFEVPT